MTKVYSNIKMLYLMEGINMRIIVNKTDFSKVLSRIYRVVDRRNSSAILGSIFIEAKNNKIMLRATDLEIEIMEEMEAQCLENGKATLPAQLLHDLIKRLPNNNNVIKIEYDGAKQLIRLSSDNISYNLKSLPFEDFPALEVGQWRHNFNLDRQTLKLMLNRITQAMSSEDTRYTLNGIEMRIIDKQLKLAATDGHRLAVGTLVAPAGSEEIKSIIIPRKAVAELQKMLSEDFEEEIHLQLSETKIEFNFGQVILRSKLIEGRFPDYEKVIPTENHNKLRVDREDFIALVSSVSVVASDYGRALICQLTQDNLKLRMESLDSDKAEADLICEYEGDNLELGFNAKYLLDEISQFVEQDLILIFGSSDDPCIIYDGNDKNLLYVVMPMRY